jgi:hypothetical protein
VTRSVAMTGTRATNQEFTTWKQDVTHHLRQAGFSVSDVFYAMKYIGARDYFDRRESAADFARRAIEARKAVS